MTRLATILLLSAALAVDPAAASELQQADLVLVRKSHRLLYLLKDGMPFRTYPIALGNDPLGHKVMAGDGRTPEGRYTVDWRNPESRFYKSLHISYPNENDQHMADALGVDPGGMIMIHGESQIPVLRRVNAARQDWTEGCIAVADRAIDEIWEAVPDGTPIEILP